METNGAFNLIPLLKTRENDSHKGNYGHLLIVAGTDAMPGAAQLATGAALKSGCGLVTLHSTELACRAAIVNFPSAMLSIDAGNGFSELPENLKKYSVIAAGPGLGKSERTRKALKCLVSEARSLCIPMVLDADALNIIAEDESLLDMIPEGSVMTPHPGELKRLLSTGLDINTLARRSGCVIVSKGFRSHICCPDGTVYENTTGNPGMAKGGSGDVLTGFIGGLMARGYSAPDASRLGVWIHGYAGDCLSRKFTAEAFSSKDLIDSLYLGFKFLYMGKK